GCAGRSRRARKRTDSIAVPMPPSIGRNRLKLHVLLAYRAGPALQGARHVTTATETRKFEAEVAQVLHLVTHSLYSHKEIFLRELVSNASDACDKLRFEAIGKPELLGGEGELHIEVSWDKAARTITVRDNGIGMDRDEVVANIGSIASSGTRRFLEA